MPCALPVQTSGTRTRSAFKPVFSIWYWRFTASFGCPTFLNYGRNYEGARDGFVYVYSHDSDSAYQRADRMVLARMSAISSDFTGITRTWDLSARIKTSVEGSGTGFVAGWLFKPSDRLRMKFPRYTYDDMVEAQERLLTEKLGVDHLRLILGTSMGGMHAWLWGERHPDFMDALMPLASLPVEIAGRNRMQRRMIIDSIRSDPGWNNGEYKTQPRGLRSAVYIEIIMVSSPRRWQKEAPSREAADRLLDQMVSLRLARTDANDLLYQFDASREYNPAPDLGKIKAPLLAINSADDEINPPELGIMEKEIKRVRRGRYVLLPVSDDTRGHGTHSYPAIWKRHLAELLGETEKR